MWNKKMELVLSMRRTLLASHMLNETYWWICVHTPNWIESSDWRHAFLFGKAILYILCGKKNNIRWCGYNFRLIIHTKKIKPSMLHITSKTCASLLVGKQKPLDHSFHDLSWGAQFFFLCTCFCSLAGACGQESFGRNINLLSNVHI